MKLKLKRLPRLSTKPTGIASKQRRCCRSATRLSYTKSANTVSRRARAITSFRRALRAEVRAGVVDPRPASPLAEAPTSKDLPDQEPCSENQTVLNSRGSNRRSRDRLLWDAPVERSPGKLASLAPNHEARASLCSALNRRRFEFLLLAAITIDAADPIQQSSQAGQHE